MISIIICARTPVINEKLRNNISETIGYTYELVVVDNSDKKYSIFEAYNCGIKISTGDYYCFIHDDIIIHTQDWGKELVRIFETDSAIGLIGVAGAKIKTKMPSAWWDCPDSQKVMHIKQHNRADEVGKLMRGFGENLYEEVSVIDGVFMAARQYHGLAFDEALNGFHNYDLNLSVIYKLKNYKIVVTKTILLEHFSSGTRDRKWFISTLKFDSLYGKYFPLRSSQIMNESELEMLEFENGSVFCKNLIKYNLKVEAVKYWCKLFVLKPVAKFHFHFIKLLLA